VRPSNAEEIIGQWINVHGLSTVPSHVQNLAGHLRRVWHGANGDAVIEAFSIRGMAHGVPLATGKTDRTCGAPGPFFLDVGISSTHHIANFWGLTKVGVQAGCAPWETWSAPSDGALSGEVEVIARVSAAAAETMDARFEWQENHRTHRSLDPNVVIAEAFKAAGLPAPENNIHPPGSPVFPHPIIDAALKAAGLMRR